MTFWYSRFLALLVLLTLAVPHSVYAQTTADSLRSQIQSHNSQIEQLEKEIAAYQKEMNALGTKRSTLESTLKEIELSRQKLSANLAITQNKIASANLRIKELSLSIGDKEETIDSHRSLIARSMRDLAADDSTSLVERMAASERLADAWMALDEVASMKRALGDRIKELAVAKVELTDNRDEVTKTKDKLAALETQLLVERKSVDASKAAQQALIAQTKNQESEYQKLIAQKQTEKTAFEAALFQLASQLTTALDTSRIPSAASGILLWPLDSVFVTQEFGHTTSSGRLYASGTHDGIDLRAAVGTPVRAALAGTILEINQGAVPNCQYGKWVLVKHVNGLTTLYAHLSEIAVKKGQAVGTGQVVGFAGSTGYATGPHLHFTVYASQALSFKQYTCKSGSVVTVPIAPPTAYLNPLLYLPK